MQEKARICCAKTAGVRHASLRSMKKANRKRIFPQHTARRSRSGNIASPYPSAQKKNVPQQRIHMHAGSGQKVRGEHGNIYIRHFDITTKMRHNDMEPSCAPDNAEPPRAQAETGTGAVPARSQGSPLRHTRFAPAGCSGRRKSNRHFSHVPPRTQPAAAPKTRRRCAVTERIFPRTWIKVNTCIKNCL